MNSAELEVREKLDSFQDEIDAEVIKRNYPVQPCQRLPSRHEFYALMRAIRIPVPIDGPPPSAEVNTACEVRMDELGIDYATCL